jgi:hypothetical protein
LVVASKINPLTRIPLFVPLDTGGGRLLRAKLNTHCRFTLAGLQNLEAIGSRNLMRIKVPEPLNVPLMAVAVR